jgi:hypothetical protein
VLPAVQRDAFVETTCAVTDALVVAYNHCNSGRSCSCRECRAGDSCGQLQAQAEGAQKYDMAWGRANRDSACCGGYQCCTEVCDTCEDCTTDEDGATSCTSYSCNCRCVDWVRHSTCAFRCEVYYEGHLTVRLRLASEDVGHAGGTRTPEVVKVNDFEDCEGCATAWTKRHAGATGSLPCWYRRSWARAADTAGSTTSMAPPGAIIFESERGGMFVAWLVFGLALLPWGAAGFFGCMEVACCNALLAERASAAACLSLAAGAATAVLVSVGYWAAAVDAGGFDDGDRSLALSIGAAIVACAATPAVHLWVVGGLLAASVRAQAVALLPWGCCGDMLPGGARPGGGDLGAALLQGPPVYVQGRLQGPSAAPSRLAAAAARSFATAAESFAARQMAAVEAYQLPLTLLGFTLPGAVALPVYVLCTGGVTPDLPPSQAVLVARLLLVFLPAACLLVAPAALPWLCCARTVAAMRAEDARDEERERERAEVRAQRGGSGAPRDITPPAPTDAAAATAERLFGGGPAPPKPKAETKKAVPICPKACRCCGEMDNRLRLGCVAAALAAAGLGTLMALYLLVPFPHEREVQAHWFERSVVAVPSVLNLGSVFFEGVQVCKHLRCLCLVCQDHTA